MNKIFILMILLLIMTIVIYNQSLKGQLGLPLKLIYALVFGLFILSLFNYNKSEHFELIISNNKIIKKDDL